MVRFRKLLSQWFLIGFFFCMSQGLDTDSLHIWQDSWKDTIFHTLLQSTCFLMFSFCWVDRNSVPSVEAQHHQVWGSELNFVLWLDLSDLMHERLWSRDCGILGLFWRPPLILARLHILAETLIWIHFTWKWGTELPFHGGKLLKAWLAIQLCV